MTQNCEKLSRVHLRIRRVGSAERNRAMQTIDGNQKEEAQEVARIAETGLVCNLASTHELVDGAIGTTHVDIKASQLAFDTGAGVNIIRRESLKDDWDRYTENGTGPPRLNDANGRPLSIGESVWLTV